MVWKEKCPFCNVDESINKVVWETKYWKIFVALKSYTADDFHLIVFPKKHKIFFWDLVEDEISDLKNVHTLCKKYFWEKNYFSCTREALSNRSIEHYHMHFIAGKLQDFALIDMLKNQK